MKQTSARYDFPSINDNHAFIKEKHCLVFLRNVFWDVGSNVGLNICHVSLLPYIGLIVLVARRGSER